MTNPNQCPDCQELADGLDGIHCQLCWEKLCSVSWWEMVNALVAAEEVSQ